MNWLAAFWAVAGFACYVLVYTVWLKRRTPQNIVIGGAAGAVPPLVAWAAVDGSVTATAVAIFAIVFLWTPPHFWALALLLERTTAARACRCCRPCGARASPRGRSSSTRCCSSPRRSLPVALGTLGWFYAAAAALLGARFIWFAVRLLQAPECRRPRGARSSTRCSTSRSVRRHGPRPRAARLTPRLRRHGAHDDREAPRLAAREERVGVDLADPAEEVALGVVIRRAVQGAGRVPPERPRRPPRAAPRSPARLRSPCPRAHHTGCARSGVRGR